MVTTTQITIFTILNHLLSGCLKQGFPPGNYAVSLIVLGSHRLEHDKVIISREIEQVNGKAAFLASKSPLGGLTHRDARLHALAKHSQREKLPLGYLLVGGSAARRGRAVSLPNSLFAR